MTISLELVEGVGAIERNLGKKSDVDDFPRVVGVIVHGIRMRNAIVPADHVACSAGNMLHALDDLEVFAGSNR